MTQPDEEAQAVGPSRDSAAETAALAQTCKSSHTRPKPNMRCRTAGCPIRSKGPRYRFLCWKHAGLPAPVEKRLKRKVEIAALTAAGRTQREIAREVGIARQNVARHQETIKSDPALVQMVEEIRSQLQATAGRLMEKHLDTLDKGMSDPEVPLKEKATAFREIRETFNPRNAWESQGQPRGPQFALQTENPQVMASFVEALRMLNEPSGRTVEAEVVREDK